jgi:hypothetical protein
MHRRIAAAAAVAGLALAGAGPAAAAPQNLEVVNGNNGTVKADVVGDGCHVTIDWYGMDSSALTSVEFALHGRSGDEPLITEFEVLDADGAHGGDLDGSRTYDLGPAIGFIGGTPDQTYQVKITTHTTYSQGADTKYKVVSVTGCEGGGSSSSS